MLDGASLGLVELPRRRELRQVVDDASLGRHPVVGRLVVVNAKLVKKVCLRLVEPILSLIKSHQ